MSSVKVSDPNLLDVKMLNLNASKPHRSDPKPSAIERTQAKAPAADDPRQRRLMVGSLCLLLLTLSIVLWHDRDFWFPDSPDEDADTDQPVEIAPPAQPTPVPASTVVSNLTPPETLKRKTINRAIAPAKTPLNTETAASLQPGTSAIPNGTLVVASRTVLPPLQVEVVAGDSHHIVHPGNNSVRVDLQPGTSPQPALDSGTTVNDRSAGVVTANASERVQISANTTAVVASPVRPSYPLLARQMKVQGAVVLQALIGRDGAIQNLRLVSGPRILASAAEDAVRQWRFKPHYQGSEPVETQANITVNFTISTN
ncbi:MAG: energy transducer TonB [Candidatus Sulfotelmatobacter sp.]|jgi:TonB family protein